MKFTSKNKKVFILLSILYLTLPRETHAYLDPGTGSYIIQILIATLAGGTYLIVASWDKVKKFFTKILSQFSNKEQSDEKQKQ